MVKNLSRGGALLYVQQPVGLRENIRIAIEVPEYNDVITTTGEVVRTFPLHEGIDEFAFAMAVKFIDLAEENLKFFTGNLATEWHKEHKEPHRVALSGHGFSQPIFYGITTILAVFLISYVIRANSHDRVNPDQIGALESRFEKLESSLKTLQDVSVSNRNIEDRLHDIQLELTDFKNNLAAVHTAAVEQSPEPVDSNQENHDNGLRTAFMEHPAAATTDSDKNDPAPASATRHVVIKGENLYRIALKRNLDVDTIRELNNLPPDCSIHPGQKLFIP